jgi:superfamily II DNA/RNA helicase
MAPEITRLTEQFLRDPVRIEVTRPATTGQNIVQTLVRSGPTPEDKRATLRRLVRSAENFKNALVFCNRKRDVQILFRSLEKHGFSVDALHGDLDQRARMAALDGFRNGQVQLLVCSDVAARGLDIPDVSHVINYDAPHHSEDYVHRIGRTGRAGKSGVALTIVTSEDSRAVDEIQKLIGRKVEFAAGEPGVADEAQGVDRERRRGRDRGRGREDHAHARHGEEQRPSSRARPERREASPRPERREASPRPERREASPRPARPKGKEVRRDPERELPVVGLGDHIPSFLLRPARVRRPAAVEAED